MDAYRHNITQQYVQDDVEDKQGDNHRLENDNHIVVILPFNGHVWEIDSYDQSGPLHLGCCGDDWTMIATTRLKMWYGITAATGVPVDIQAILKSS